MFNKREVNVLRNLLQVAMIDKEFISEDLDITDVEAEDLMEKLHQLMICFE